MEHSDAPLERMQFPASQLRVKRRVKTMQLGDEGWITVNDLVVDLNHIGYLRTDSEVEQRPDAHDDGWIWVYCLRMKMGTHAYQHHLVVILPENLVQQQWEGNVANTDTYLRRIDLYGNHTDRNKEYWRARYVS